MFRKKLTREQVRRFMADHPACTVVFEACSSASHWAREMARLGHDARLIAPHYVRPFVTRQKTDGEADRGPSGAALADERRRGDRDRRTPARDALSPKTEDQQARGVLFRGRERLVPQRTADVNALRALLYEQGHVFATGRRQLERMTTLVEDETSDVPAPIREEGRDLAAQIAEKTDRIGAKTRALKELAAATDTARRLQTMPGIGAGGRAADSRGGRGVRS